MLWFRTLTARREAREADATALLEAHGEAAYSVARDRMRAARAQGDRAGDRHWSKVAVAIAGRTGREIGLDSATRRYRDWEESYARPPQQDHL